MHPAIDCLIYPTAKGCTRKVFWQAVSVCLGAAVLVILSSAILPAPLIKAFLFVAGTWSQFSLYACRLHNSGRSRWLVLLLPIPIVGFYVILVSIFAKPKPEQQVL